MSTRLVVYVLALAFALVSFGSLAVESASAQPAPAQVKPPPRSATPAGKSVPDRDVVTKQDDAGKPRPGKPKTSTGMALAFWLFAFLTVAGSIFVLTRKNLIAAVMGMVGTFFGLAALYMMLYAHFLAVIQMLVYAGAIMVLFVFVIMILNKPEDEPYAKPGKAGKALAGLAMLYLLFRLGSVLVSVDTTVTAPQLAAPAQTAQGYDWGSTASVGWNLFNEYLFPFEAVSILLLVAVVGSIAIARPLQDDESEVAP
ncbi:MAG: NADH-quinone oxidoreductase subunit J [Bauldia sp.]|nr:MAG: NADH-quinone oxidoreductase subunit J [Bauldia sp.]